MAPPPKPRSWRKRQSPRNEPHAGPEHSETESSGRAGRVLARHGANIDVEDERRLVHRCSARKRVGSVVCGDEVRWQPGPHKSGIIVSVAPRRSLLARPDDRGRVKPIAANIDQILIIIAANRLNTASQKQRFIDTLLLDRYIVAAEASNIRPILVVNKNDELDDQVKTAIARQLQPYEHIGYDVLFTSTKSNAGINQLNALLEHRVNVFVGQSGVGKSSLIELFIPDHTIRTGAVSDLTGLGRHTTTTTTLYHLPAGGDLIDSPGVREFGLWNITPADLAAAYVEFRAYLGQCKFNDCRHAGEPGCAVTNATHKKVINQRRFENYRNILDSLS